MISSLLKVGGFIFDKLKGNPDKPPRYVFMKRVSFFVVLALLLWALVHPESLFIRLERAAEIMPDWFMALLTTMFASVWL